MRPLVPITLGVLGLIPFLAGAAGLALLPALAIPAAFYLMKVYALLILAFLGGVHWGRALSSMKAASFVWSVTPSLLGLAAAFLPPQPMFTAFAAAFLLAGLVDVVVFARSGPRWYVALRVFLTLVVGAALIFAAMNASDWDVDPFGILV